MIRIRFVLSLLLLLLIIAALIGVLILPKYMEYQALSLEYNRKLLAHQTRQSYFESYDEMRKQVLQLQTNIDDQLKRIRPMEKLNHLIVNLGISFSNHLLHETDFSLGRTTFSTPSGTDFSVGKTTVALSGVGTYENIMAFISHLHDAEEYYQIDNLLISSENVLLEDSLFVRLDITIYTTEEEGEDESPYVEYTEFQDPFYHS